MDNYGRSDGHDHQGSFTELDDAATIYRFCALLKHDLRLHTL